MESSITSKGQITIPKAIRDQLNLAPGDKVKFFIQPDGNLAILPKLPASALRGIVRPLGRPVTLEEMDAAIAKGATRRYRRFLRQ
jgi:AbrB family looped-hinge helix DNA binding protein